MWVLPCPLGISWQDCPQKIFLAIHLKEKFLCFKVLFCSYFLRVIVTYKYLPFSIFETGVVSQFSCNEASAARTCVRKGLTFAVFVSSQKAAWEVFHVVLFKI